MKMTSLPKHRIVFSVVALCFLFLAMIWISYFRQISFDRKAALQFAIEKNSNLAVVVEQQAISTLQNADAALQLVMLEYTRQGDSLNLEQFLAKTGLKSGIIDGIFIINSQGKLVMTNHNTPKNVKTDFSGDPYFAFHSKNQTDSLLVSKPFRLTPKENPLIIISRRFNDLRGQFAGVVAVQLKPCVFTSFYAHVKLLPNDIISLIAPDGITYARRTGTIESSGEDISKSPLFSHIRQNPDSFYLALDAIRHIPTWFSYRKLKNYPIIATVGSSEADILLANSNTQSRYLTPRLITSILLILFFWLITQFLLQRRKAIDLLQEEKERYERLLVEQMITVQEREREWIGRELHDNVSQVLTTVKLYLDIASKQHDDPLIPKSMQLINNSIVEIRNLSHQLSAPTLGTGSLVDAIQALIEMVNGATPIVFEFDHSRYHVQLPMGHKITLYRILQEQINNIIKHAEATKVWISIYQRGHNVHLAIKDNGKGFDSRRKTNGMGLNSITSRVKVLGGTIYLKTAPEKGCLLWVSVPVASIMEMEASNK
jgi:signal transduction histidine kinase